MLAYKYVNPFSFTINKSINEFELDILGTNCSLNKIVIIQVVSTRVTIKRDEPRGHIEVNLTVPFGCPFMPDGKIENCGLDIEMNVPRDPKKCSPDIKVAKTLFSQGKNCGFRIFKNDWQQKVILPIAFIDMPEYNLVLPDSPDGAFRIGMITAQKDGSPEWSGIELQDVFVHVCTETRLY